MDTGRILKLKGLLGFFLGLSLTMSVGVPAHAQGGGNKGVGLVLLTALKRVEAGRSSDLFICLDMKRYDIYQSTYEQPTYDSEGGFSTVYTKMNDNGACTVEKLDTVLKRHPCLQKEMAWAERMAGYISAKYRGEYEVDATLFSLIHETHYDDSWVSWFMKFVGTSQANAATYQCDFGVRLDVRPKVDHGPAIQTVFDPYTRPMMVSEAD